jgi:aspartate dehydrogenase
MRRVGIIGYGAVGRYLARAIRDHKACRHKLELAFVCEPIDPAAVHRDESLPPGVALDDLRDFASKGADLVVEVAHPSISTKYGAEILRSADYMVASVTTFADEATEKAVREAVTSGPHGCYIPAGALWGSHDIQRMADLGNLRGLTVTMKKAPHHLKLMSPLREKLEEIVASGAKGESVLYEGPVRGLAPLAPNNTNTIAAAAMAAHTLGMDRTIGRLICDPSLEAHIVEVEVEGSRGDKHVTRRYNPAQEGAVTGDATYASFLGSMLGAHGRGSGFHFC